LEPPGQSSCVICFEHIAQKNKAIIKNCSHEFCFVCIKSWIENAVTCPLCKQEFNVLQHSFTSDGTYQEEKIEPPKTTGDSGGPVEENVEDQLQCLDHAFFIQEVQRLLQDAERVHHHLWVESLSQRGLLVWEKARLATAEEVIAELRNHKRKLQAFLQFDPHSTLQDLYRLQDLLSTTYGQPVIPTSQRSRSPVRYGADDADAVSDDDDFAEDLAYLSLSKNKKKQQTPLPALSKTKGRASGSSGKRNKRRGHAN